jgi:glutamate--cysteine ligase
MTSFRSDKADPVTSKAQLIETLASGCKPKAEWRIGTEHEKFPFAMADLSSLPYAGTRSIHAILTGLTRFGWEPVREGDNVISLKQDGKGTVSLEPGGQLELSGATLATLHQTAAEIDEHLAQVKAVTGPLGVGMLGLGMTPTWRREDIQWMPKGRYAIMRAYMPTVGTMGVDMMTRTCTVQVNLDYASEADMVKKLRVSLALQPLATALFANSPFTDGKPNGFLSYRANIWRHTDPARTGLLPFAFAPSMGFERYVDYLLDVPMYFVYRNGFIDVAGQSFRDFMNGRLSALPGEAPTVADWFDHMSTAFPEVRVKNYLEMRGADAGDRDRLVALPALWVGLLYDEGSLDAAWSLVKGWTEADRTQLYADVPKQGLAAGIGGRALKDIAVEVLGMAQVGLKRRANTGPAGDESCYLDPLLEIASSGVTPAERMLALYHGAWRGDLRRAYETYSF